jgi:hypothetical protein
MERSVLAPIAVYKTRETDMFRFAVILMTLATAGCLQKETIHTLYLGADGMTWVASEANVHSDESDPGKRFAEEQSYIGPALLGSHPVARGLQALGPDSLVRTTIVREERPFHVITEARFARADRALERLFVESGIPARVTMAQEEGRTSLHVRFDFSRQMVERDTPSAALLEDIERFVFVLADGQFIAGGGFEVPDRARAKLARESFDAIEDAIAARRAIELTLTWSLESSDSR